MNWLDVIIILILLFSVFKGLRLGLVLSIFNIIRTILSILITIKIYPIVHEYIISSPAAYGIFEGITKTILSILFNSQAKDNPNFIPNLMSGELVGIIIKLLSIIFIFWLVSVLMNLILGLFSFILNVPILKQLNKVGGIIFGLMEGIFIVYFITLILTSIATFSPESLIGEGVYNSLIVSCLKDLNLLNLMIEILSNRTYI